MEGKTKINIIKKKYLLIVITAVCQFAGCDFSERQSLFSNDVDTLLMNNSKVDSLSRADSLRYKKEIEKIKQEAREELDSIKNIYEERSGQYHVIAGSFKIEKNAARYAKKISQLGFVPKILKYNGYFLVSSSGHQTLEQAILARNHMRSSVSVKAWIYVEE